MAGSSTLSGEQVERELESLLDKRSFAPPSEFVAGARLNDPAIYDKAERDYQRWWEAQAAELDWFEPWGRVLDWSNPPFAKWFVGGKLNASHNCLDRHIEAGRGDRVAYHWRGEEGEERDLTYADLYVEVQRLANALKKRGIGRGDVVGIYLPMIPELVVLFIAWCRL
jgi:acetyl-CoA synthetase